jgi:uncharacterized NAD(P)/FAD-binding protein YdhS
MSDPVLRFLEPRLVACIRRGSGRQLLDFARACARFALHKTDLMDETLLEAVKLQHDSDASLIERVRAIVKDLDKKGFDLRDAFDDDRGTLQEYQIAFAKARAAESVLAQLEETDPVAAAARAAYEAKAATKDPQSILQIAIDCFNVDPDDGR